MAALIVILMLALIALFCVVFFSRRRKFSEKDQRMFIERWQQVTVGFKNNPAKRVLDADKLLDFAMSRKGFSGSMGEKLKKADHYFSRIQEVWYAHKLRNRIAHEVGYEVSEREAVDALSKFKLALQELGLRLRS